MPGYIPKFVLKTHYLENLPKKMFHVEMNTLQKPPVAQPVKTLTALNGSLRFMTTFTISYHSALSLTPHFLKNHFHITKLAHPCLRFASGLVPSKFPTIYIWQFYGLQQVLPISTFLIWSSQ